MQKKESSSKSGKEKLKDNENLKQKKKLSPRKKKPKRTKDNLATMTDSLETNLTERPKNNQARKLEEKVIST